MTSDAHSDKRIFRVAAALHAEAAAHIVADHPELVLRQFEDAVGQCRPGGVHRLDRAADRIAVLIAVVLGEATARLHAVRRDPVDDHRVTNDMVGPGECRIDRGLVADLVKECLVARVLLPDRGRARRERRFGA